MMDLIPQIHEIWTKDRHRIIQSVDSIKEGFSKTLTLGSSAENLTDDVIMKAKQSLDQQFDETHGGFGSRPKFPSPHNLLFLLHHAEAAESQSSKKMALHTLRQMRLGGLWDHIGGGFHRYSTDEKWLLPHFEKMLYDQAMLLLAYTEGWRMSGDLIFKDTCYRIFDYLVTNMRSPLGAFYSAEDADSEGEEGKFYVWEKHEIFDHLTKEKVELFCDVYNIKEEGNFRDEASGQITGQNIPHLRERLSEYASKNSLNYEKLEKSLTQIRTELFDIRKDRVPPLLDDKILTDWNGFLIAALATAGAVFNDSEFTDSAAEIESFISSKLVSSDGQLLHRFRDGDAGIDAMADDYTSLVWGLIELYQTTQNPEYLQKAIHFQTIFSQEFSDDENGGYYFTSKNTDTQLGRQKEIYDGALPSSNSMAALNGFRLARLTGKTDYESKAEKIFRAFSQVIKDNPSAYTFALITKLTQKNEPREIAVASHSGNNYLGEILDYLSNQNRFQNSVILNTEKTQETLRKLSPFTESFPIDESLNIYVCKNFSCDTPVHSLDKLIENLR